MKKSQRNAFAAALASLLTIMVFLVGLGLPDSVTAEENESPIPKLLIQEIEAGADPVYSLTRCAGLYLSIFEWAGPTRLGQANADAIRNSVVSLNALATTAIVQTSEVSEETATSDADEKIRGHANIYIKHFQAVSSVVGKAFLSDELIKNDGATCQSLLAG